MAKERKSKVISLSLPPEAEAEFIGLAKELGKSRSELFREMLEVYRREQLWREFKEIQRYVSAQAQAVVIETEEEIVELVREARKESRR